MGGYKRNGRMIDKRDMKTKSERNMLTFFIIIIFSSGLSLGTVGPDGEPDWMGWVIFGSVLWAVWAFVEQQTIALMMIVKSSYSAGSASVALTTFYLLVASASLRLVQH